MASTKGKRPASPGAAQLESKKQRREFLSEEDLDNVARALNTYAELDPVPNDINIPKALLARFMGTVVMELRRIPSCVDHIEGDWSLAKVNALPEDEFRDLATKYIQAHAGNWNELIYAPYLWKPIANPIVYVPPSVSQRNATVTSWNYNYVGIAPQVLWEHINYYCKPDNKENKHYAHFATIVQSSGTGKSRAVDELAKVHIVVPLNLEKGDATGFPPPDDEIRDWLLAVNSRPLVNNRIIAFLEALFVVTQETLQKRYGLDGGLGGIAAGFRVDMNDGMKFGSHGPFRKEFYTRVTKLADEIVKKHYTAEEVIHMTPTKKPKEEQRYVFRPAEACEALVGFLQQIDKDYQRKTGQVDAKNANTPLVIISFDEAHTLTDRKDHLGEQFSAFGELRIALRSLIHSSIFALFLSTTGKISQFLSPKDKELSTRLVEGYLKLIQPFTDLAFDTYAIILDGTRGFSLDLVTGDEYMSRLGRPLFGSRWIAGDENVRAEAVVFARQKLLCGQPGGPLTLDQQLACLSQRLALEYNTTKYVAREAERRQVEGHMRICLKIDENFESMISISGSEPLLAEAAYSALLPSEAPHAMKAVLEGFSVHKGDRGELLSMLLMMLARDAAVGQPLETGVPTTGKRYVSVSAFFENLFTAFTPNVERRTRHQEGLFETFRHDFEDSYVYFNHFIKVHQHAVLKAGYLLAILARGGGVLCANNQPGVDALVMMVHGLLAMRSTLGLILWQVKNNPAYTRWDPNLFAAMDPFTLKIWNEHDRPTKPIIRIVFALAAKKGDFQIARTVVKANPKTGSSAYVAYDIWCAGVSPEVLAPIDPTLDHLWKALLQASAGYGDVYKGPLGSANQEAMRRGVDVTTCADDRHFMHFENLSLD